jgi:hypothetical protein
MKVTLVGISSQNEGSLTFSASMVPEFRMRSLYVVKRAARDFLG